MKQSELLKLMSDTFSEAPTFLAYKCFFSNTKIMTACFSDEKYLTVELFDFGAGDEHSYFDFQGRWSDKEQLAMRTYFYAAMNKDCKETTIN